MLKNLMIIVVGVVLTVAIGLPIVHFVKDLNRPKVVFCYDDEVHEFRLWKSGLIDDAFATATTNETLRWKKAKNAICRNVRYPEIVDAIKKLETKFGGSFDKPSYFMIYLVNSDGQCIFSPSI